MRLRIKVDNVHPPPCRHKRIILFVEKAGGGVRTFSQVIGLDEIQELREELRSDFEVWEAVKPLIFATAVETGSTNWAVIKEALESKVFVL